MFADNTKPKVFPSPRMSIRPPAAQRIIVWQPASGCRQCPMFALTPMDIKKFKGYINSAKKWYHSIMVLWPYYVITCVAWGIFFDEISVSLDCCITGLWHPINRNYVFNVKIIIICDLFSYFKIMKIL